MKKTGPAFFAVLAAFALMLPAMLLAQKWDKDYDPRPQQVIANLSRINGLAGWTANAPAAWPPINEATVSSALKRPIGGAQWAAGDQGPYRLTRLIIANHNLQRSADFSGLTSLESLEVYGNQLRGLNIDGNTALTHLLAMNNQIAALNPASAPGLSRLALANNKLTKIDLSRNPALIQLDVSSNQLAALDLSGNHRLETVNALNNSLAAIDLSAQLELTALGISHNQIESLNLKSNARLKELRARNNKLSAVELEQNADLTELALSHNRLTALDLTANQSLVKLSADNNLIQTIDLSRCRNLELIDFSENPLTEIRLGDNSLAELDSLNLDGCRLPLSQLWPLSGKAKRKGRFGRQDNVLFENADVAVGEALDLSAENNLGGAATEFTVLTEKKHRAKKDVYSVDGGLVTFHVPGLYIIQMTNANVVSAESGSSAAKARKFKVKVFTGIVEVRPAMADDTQ